LNPGQRYIDYLNRFSATTIGPGPGGLQVRILLPTAAAPAVMFATPQNGAMLPSNTGTMA
jgi:hypothetical protein